MKSVVTKGELETIKMIVSRYKRISDSMNVMPQTVYVVVNELWLTFLRPSLIAR